MTSKFTAVAKKRVKTIETPPSTIANIMKLFTVIDKDADGRIMSHDMGKHLYAINRLYKLLHDLPAAVRGFTDTNDIIAHFDENEDGELNFQEFLKGMTETGAFEKVAKKSLGKHSSTSRALDNAISGIKDSLLDAVTDCKLDAVRISLRGLFKLYEKSTSSHKAARRFRDLQDAVRCIPRRTLGCASALAVLDILHEYLRQDAAIIVTRAMRLNKEFRGNGGSAKSMQKWSATFSRIQNIERRRQRQATIYRRNKRRADKNAKDKAATYLQTLFRGKMARKKYGDEIQQNLQLKKDKKKAEKEAKMKQIAKAKRKALKEKMEREQVYRRLSQDTTNRNPFQTQFMSTFTNLKRPRLGKFITGGIKEAIEYKQKQEMNTQNATQIISGMLSSPKSSSPNNGNVTSPNPFKSLPSPIIMNDISTNATTKMNGTSNLSSTTTASFRRNVLPSPTKNSILSVPLSAERRLNTAPMRQQQRQQQQQQEEQPAISKSVLEQFEEAGLYSGDNLKKTSVLQSRRDAQRRKKTAITRATVGTSKDQWKDEHDKLYSSSKYVNKRNANWMKQINNIYAKPIPRPSRRKIPTNYSKNRTGSRNITPSPRKRRVINALDNARKFMQTR